MSLVNDMLHDLDARQPHTSNPRDHLPSGLSRRASAGAWRFVLMGFVVVLAISALGYWYVATSIIKPATSSALKNLSDTNLVATDVVERTTAISPSSLNAQTVSSQESVVQPHSMPSRELLKNLRLAKAAWVAGQLTTPLDASAYWYYQQALRFDPNNSEARAGITQIATHYFSQAQRAESSGDDMQALALLERVLAITPDHPSAQTMLAKLQSLPVTPSVQQATADYVVEPMSDNTAGPNNSVTSPSVASSLGLNSVKPKDSSNVNIRAVSDVDYPEEQSDGVNLSWTSRDQQARGEAERLVARGQPERARRLLEAFVADASKTAFMVPYSRRYLQSLLLQASEFAAAEQLIAPELDLADKHYMQARLHEYQGELIKALQVLEQGYASAEADEAYRALAASLYQMTKNYSAAENHYRRLLEVFGPRARYWLGLALSLDQQQRYPLASVAYRRAREASDTTQVIVDFSDQRLIQIGM
ncbi:tetratricopeptide repeat protein [Gilvimarinus polysaccharolyticus]|uniref:tetratricopeptide repeat protein n=1 Tax=Gilvimarinus polysaccharolyticus TaxID=863921 RepID=UPI00067331B0|nr:tetratricopeptide repeat protein [Gilvimarinus polysaccharolyticus]